VDFSSEFSSISKDPEKEAKLLKCITFPLKKFDNIKDVRILVNGNEYKPVSKSAAAMSDNFVNTLE